MAIILEYSFISIPHLHVISLRSFFLRAEYYLSSNTQIRQSTCLSSAVVSCSVHRSPEGNISSLRPFSAASSVHSLLLSPYLTVSLSLHPKSYSSVFASPVLAFSLFYIGLSLVLMVIGHLQLPANWKNTTVHSIQSIKARRKLKANTREKRERLWQYKKKSRI